MEHNVYANVVLLDRHLKKHVFRSI